jgi:hypothetical protein
MAEMTLEIGATARWDDDSSGEVISLAVDPTAWRVTHLVVEPKHRQGLARLVPADDRVQQDSAGNDGLRLRYTEKEFEELPAAEETLAEFEPAVLVPYQGASAGPASPWNPSTSCPPSFPGKRRNGAATACRRPTATSATCTPCASTATPER